MTEAKSVAKDNANSHMLETGPFGESCVRIQDIVKRGRAWCVRRSGKFYKMKGSYILEECPGCGSSAIKWSGIRNKRQSNKVITLRCNRQGRGRCDHADARRRIQARAENRARIEALKQSAKPTEPSKRKSSSQVSEPPPSKAKAMPGIDGPFAPKMFTLAAAALHMSRMEIEQPTASKPKLTSPQPHTQLDVSGNSTKFHPAAGSAPKSEPDFQRVDYCIGTSDTYDAFNPMTTSNEPEPTFPMGIRSKVCHSSSLQSKHPLVPLLTLQQPIPSHNPQVQPPPIFVTRHLVMAHDRQLAFQINPQIGL